MPRSTAPVSADLSASWNTIKAMRSEQPDVSQPIKTEDMPFVQAEQYHQRKIARSATEFLKQHGFTAGGRTTRKIPGL